VQQDTVTTTTTRERSVLRRGSSARPTVFPNDKPSAPAAPAEVEPAPKTSGKPTANLSPLGRFVLAVNQYRAGKGLEPLIVDPILMKVAQNAAPYFSHQINGKWCWTRAHEAGFPGWATDDIANGYESPEDAVAGWATSDGHAHQMRGDFNMNGEWKDYKFNRIGVGISGRKYIAVFGHSDESATKPVAFIRTDKKCQCQSGGVCTCGAGCKCSSR